VLRTYKNELLIEGVKKVKFEYIIFLSLFICCFNKDENKQKKKLQNCAEDVFPTGYKAILGTTKHAMPKI